jgi:large subunit ribosomal protein L10
MAISKAKKSEIVSDVSKILADSKNVVFVNFHKLTVIETGEVRKALRAAGVGYRVAKKTLIKRALEEAKVTGEIPALDGEIALVYGADLLAPAREVVEFTKKFKDKLSIVGGVFDGIYKTKAEMISIASIPSMHTLQAQFVQLINSPIQRFVLALNAIADKKN